MNINNTNDSAEFALCSVRQRPDPPTRKPRQTVLQCSPSQVKTVTHLLMLPKSSKPKMSSTPMEGPWCSLLTSFLASSQLLTCRTIQSNRAAYTHLANVSRAAIAWGGERGEDGHQRGQRQTDTEIRTSYGQTGRPTRWELF